MTRVYVSSSLEGLSESVGTERILREMDDDYEPSEMAVGGHAVTDELRQALPDLDDESLEHYAMTEAAQESLHYLSTDGGWTRRLVEVIDVDSVVARPGGLTRVDAGPVVLRRAVVAYMVDTDDAVEDVEAASIAIRTDADDVDARVQRCLDHELGWYAATEVEDVLGLS